MHNHVRKVLEMIQRGELDKNALTFPRLNIFHDDWCNLLNHRGECNCNPVIEQAAVIPITGRKLNREK